MQILSFRNLELTYFFMSLLKFEIPVLRIMFSQIRSSLKHTYGIYLNLNNTFTLSFRKGSDFYFQYVDGSYRRKFTRPKQTILIKHSDV